MWHRHSKKDDEKGATSVFDVILLPLAQQRTHDCASFQASHNMISGHQSTDSD